MKNKHALWLLAFAAVAALEIFSEATSNMSLRMGTKPFLMPLLGVWFAMETAHNRKFARNTVLMALGLSAIGDTLLLFSEGPSGPLFFLLGLGAFLFAHFFYTGYFFSKDKRHNGFLKKSPVWALPALLWTAALLWWLLPDVPDAMQVPVVVYACTITAMLLSVVNLHGQVAGPVFTQLLAGGVLFVCSDSLLAINKFGHPFDGARLAIMTTYLGAQFLLVSGARKTH